MADFLQTMADSSRRRADLLASSLPELERRARDCPPAPTPAFTGFDIIAEIKRRSPAEGPLAGSGLSLRERALCYESGGAAAVSVLTEPERFDGSLDDLVAVADALVAIAPLRKDFLVAPAQVFEARLAGAGGVLLIVAMLSDTELVPMLDAALGLGLFVLLEAFDAEDLERAVRLLDTPRYADAAAQSKLLYGINTRDLKTLAVDVERLERLAPALPRGVLGVAESGVATPADAARVAALGYRAALIGTALMRAADPAMLLGAMLERGRSVSQT